jgi:hypothetical protein
MSFSARVFRILIASPSDVTEEREIAVRTIQEWNDLNSAERQLVLLPIRWETHSAPEYGKRPQEIINRLVVDTCDLMVGIFWTRVGSPTGIAESGTIEEIERVANKGKPIMLYFSQAKQDPEKIDIEQLSKLRDFKQKTFPNALIQSYADLIEFKDKLTKQLEIQLRSLIAQQSEIGMDETSVSPITDIVFHFAEVDTGRDAGTELALETSFVEITNFDELPDYTVKKKGKQFVEKQLKSDYANPNLVTLFTSSSEVNNNYYRQRATYLIQKEFFRPLRFWLQNKGGVGARDVYIEMVFKSNIGKIILMQNSRLSNVFPSKTKTGTLLTSSYFPLNPDDIIKEDSDSWVAPIEVRALQPQRELSPIQDFVIGAKESCEVIIAARIYADTLPEPLVQELKLRLNVKQFRMTAKEFMKLIQSADKGGEEEA